MCAKLTFTLGGKYVGAYTTMSGTSMATVSRLCHHDSPILTHCFTLQPYISGCIALLMEATGKKSPESVIRHLLNYAKPVYSSDGLNLESMAKQGSGLVQVPQPSRKHRPLTCTYISYLSRSMTPSWPQQMYTLTRSL